MELQGPGTQTGRTRALTLCPHRCRARRIVFGAEPPSAHGLPVACLCLPLPPLVPVSAENQDQSGFFLKTR